MLLIKDLTLDAWGRHRDKVSVIGAVSVSPAAHRLGFYFATDPGGYFTPEKVVEFLRELLKHLRGKVIVVWDGGPNHKGPAIRKFLARNKRLRLERLPAYSPDLNPVEAVWGWLKYDELANFAPRDVGHLDRVINDTLYALHRDQPRLRTFLANSPLKW